MNNSTTAAISTSNRHNQTSQEHGDNLVVIHCDGAGSRPDGKGSGFAWLQPRTGERHIEHVDGLTNNQAEYFALISALNSLANGSAAQVFTDSQTDVVASDGQLQSSQCRACRTAIAGTRRNKEEGIEDRIAMDSAPEEFGWETLLAYQGIGFSNVNVMG